MYRRKQSIKFVSELSIMMRGLKRKLAIEKQNGRGRIQTGKSPITYSMYKRINNLLLKDGSLDSIFIRAFLCITWNLMCRSQNTVSVHLHHLEWRDDALAIYFAHMKNDQTGSRKRDPRHIYANPIDYEVCPLVALGMYLNVYAPSID